MAYTVNNKQDFELGYSKGQSFASKGISEDEAIALERNSDVIEGIKEAYHQFLFRKFKDSARRYAVALNALKKDKSSRAFVVASHCACDCVDSVGVLRELYRKHLSAQVQDSLALITDADDYSLHKVNNKHFEVLKNGEKAYDLEQKQSRWTCSCTGFKYRGKCKHLALLNDILPKRHPRSEFEAAIPKVAQVFEGFKYEIVGSWRRGKSTFKDVDILVDCDKSDMKTILERLQSDPSYEHTMAGPEIIRGKYQGYDFDVSRAIPGEWGSFLLYRTGSGDFNIAMRGWLKKYGYSLNEHGLFDSAGNKLASNTEEDIFDAIGISFIKPEDRETPVVLRKELSKLKEGPVSGVKKVSDSSEWWVVWTKNKKYPEGYFSTNQDPDGYAHLGAQLDGPFKSKREADEYGKNNKSPFEFSEQEHDHLGA